MAFFGEGGRDGYLFNKRKSVSIFFSPGKQLETAAFVLSEHFLIFPSIHPPVVVVDQLVRQH